LSGGVDGLVVESPRIERANDANLVGASVACHDELEPYRALDLVAQCVVGITRFDLGEQPRCRDSADCSIDSSSDSAV
jgi:hypothetical protein